MFDSILIANRGEIALRIARTCKELGIRVVAVHSTADRDYPPVWMADEVVQIGPPAPKRSYLNAAAIIEAALHTGVDAIHPGYGFLSEDPDFAEICVSHGIAFIGPPADVIASLADKSAACEIMAKAGLPVLPGGHLIVHSGADVRSAAEAIGFPIVVKATAGGGGKGMTVVTEPDNLLSAFHATRRTAQAVFGDGRVYLEPFLEHARHVEVQVLADAHGNVVHLGCRDCSIQRRHQKLVEETPPPRLGPELMARLEYAAVQGARAVGYAGVGTFEFLVDATGRFYFMEINCRIQVEHPVTEMVTGIDLIGEQIHVAAGLPLRFDQEDVLPRGVALECRICAEDPGRDFAPAPGEVTEFLPPGGPFTRIDSHCRPGLNVTADYDSLLAKVAVWAPDRDAAIARMERALGEFRIGGRGLGTTRDFLRDLLAHPLFRDGRHTTTFVHDMFGTTDQ